MGTLTEQMKQLVERQRLGFVATVCADGTPNVSPKGTLRVLDDERLVFADLKSPATVRNLRHNPSIEVNVVDHLIRKGYRFKGHAEVLDSGDGFERLVAFYSTLGLSDAPKKIQSIVIVRVEQARPLVSPAYDYGADEASMREQWTSYYLGDPQDR
jgi:predicted pyridoxine 5'-phosphate oxidase superfamily flavin-nucleotide-binding protein